MVICGLAWMENKAAMFSIVTLRVRLTQKAAKEVFHFNCEAAPEIATGR
jgi:hypothetical protein